MRANQFVTELFEPRTADQFDPSLNVKELQKDNKMWMWQFEVPDVKGNPAPFCVRVANLHHSYYMDELLDKCWFVTFIQAKCSKPLDMSPETLTAMGDMGNIGTNSPRVFSICGSLIANVVNNTGAKGLVFNSVPERTNLYSVFAKTIQRKTGWLHEIKSGSFIMEQSFYFFAADKKTMNNMVTTFRDLGQID